MVEQSEERLRRNRPTAVSWLLYLLAITLAAQPVANKDLWWLVSHGQKVIDGCMQPASELVSCSTQESPWLAGVPLAICYELPGSLGFMLLKFLAAGYLCSFVNRTGIGCGRSAPLLCAVTMVAISPVFEPSTMLWDALGVAFTWHLLATISQRARRSIFLLAVVIAVWANVSYGVVWFFAVVFAQALLLRFALTASVGLAALGAACLSLSPRGIYALTDAALVVLPIHLPPDLRAGSPWQSIWQESFSLDLAAFLILSGVLLALCLRQSSVRPVMLLLLAVLPICCASNLPIASLLISLGSLSILDQNDSPHSPSGIQLTATAAIIISICFAVASGWFSSSCERLGWGISSSLDYRFVQRDLQQMRRANGSAHCPNIRTAGMLTFACPDGVRPVTTPTFAILNGTWTEYIQLTRDLLDSRRSSFRRQDGTTGGWWRTVEDESVTMLMVPVDNARLIRSLEPTLWKPISLDSPVIPYVRTDHRQWTSQLTQMVQQRELVNYGNWQHAPNATNANLLHTDVWERLTGAIDYRRDEQQAEAFRAMGLQTAAMRVLLPVLSENSEAVRQLFHQTQVTLALEEWKSTGMVSLLRQATIRKSVADPASLLQLSWLPDIPDNEAKAWDAPVDLYMDGDCEGAVRKLLANSAESNSEFIYAALTLSAEAGDTQTYQHLFSEMQANFPDGPWLSFVEMNQP